jgi:hypothetical protein
MPIASRLDQKEVLSPRTAVTALSAALILFWAVGCACIFIGSHGWKAVSEQGVLLLIDDLSPV